MIEAEINKITLLKFNYGILTAKAIQDKMKWRLNEEWSLNEWNWLAKKEISGFQSGNGIKAELNDSAISLPLIKANAMSGLQFA